MMSGGLIAHFGLADWWECELEEQDRQVIADFYTAGSLTEGAIHAYHGPGVSFFLGNLAEWLPAQQRTLKGLIFEEGRRQLPNCTQKDAHFYWHSAIKHYYRWRELPGYLDRAIIACEEQIKLAGLVAGQLLTKQQGGVSVAHTGYEQLAIILHKQGRYSECVKLCEKAAKQGRAGNWEGRIAKSQAAAEKVKSATKKLKGPP